MAEGMTLEEQGEVGRAFLAGLLGEYGVSATVEAASARRRDGGDRRHR